MEGVIINFQLHLYVYYWLILTAIIVCTACD